MKKNIKEFLVSSIISFVAAVAILKLADIFPYFKSPANVLMLFFTIVIFCAVCRGLTASLTSAILTFLFYNFFFTEPYYTLMVKHWYDIITLIVFLVVAVITGFLAGKVKEETLSATARINALQILYDLAKDMGAAKNQNEVFNTVLLKIYSFVQSPAIITFAQEDKEPNFDIKFYCPDCPKLTSLEREAIEWSVKNGQASGMLTPFYSGTVWHFKPIKIKSRINGILGVKVDKGIISSEQTLIIDTMLDLLLVALERIEFANAAAHAEAAAETEHFRNALLSSISHDLRTPLTSILGSVTALNSTANYSPSAKTELLLTIQEEAERLNHFVTNLLDITKLEGGNIEIKKDWIVISEVIESTVRRIKNYSPTKKINVCSKANLPLLKSDFVMLDTILFNLLDNAVKYAGEESEIIINASLHNDKVEITVADNGVGIPYEYQPYLFNKFYRVNKTDRTIAGTGLGLSICKGLVSALGGEIAVTSPYFNHKGTAFTITFPTEENTKLPEIYES